MQNATPVPKVALIQQLLQLLQQNNQQRQQDVFQHHGGSHNLKAQQGHFGDKNVCAFKEKTKGKTFLLEEPNTWHASPRSLAPAPPPPPLLHGGDSRTPHRVTLGTFLHVPAQHPGEASGLGHSYTKYLIIGPLRKITHSVDNQSRKFLCLQLLGGRQKSLFSLYPILLFLKNVIMFFFQLHSQQAVRSETEFASPEMK